MVFNEENDRLTFVIEGKDLEKTKLFKKKHDACPRGIENGRFAYIFIPTTLGTAVKVKCSCGEELLCGDFLE